MALAVTNPSKEPGSERRHLSGYRELRAARPVHKCGRRVFAVRTGDSKHLEWGMRADIYPLQTLLLTISGCKGTEQT